VPLVDPVLPTPVEGVVAPVEEVLPWVLPLMLPAVLLLPALVPTPALAPVEGAVLVVVVVVVLVAGAVPEVELVPPAMLPVEVPVLGPLVVLLVDGAVELVVPACGVELAAAELVWSLAVEELVPPAALAVSPLALGVVAAPAVAGAPLWLAVLSDLSTFNLSFTLRTPGIDWAICTARLRSSSEATLPFSLTSPLFFTLTSTLENAGSVAN
jgi:hypothetical protein